MVLDRVKVAIVGTGFGVGVHLPAFKSHPQFEVVALCGRNMDRTRAIAEREGIATAWDDYAKPDGVIRASSVGTAEVRTVHGLLGTPDSTSIINPDRT
jgi:predicted dehydrogenase